MSSEQEVFPYRVVLIHEVAEVVDVTALNEEEAELVAIRLSEEYRYADNTRAVEVERLLDSPSETNMVSNS